MSKLSLLAPVLFPVVLLSACGGGGSKSTPQPSENPSSSAISSGISSASLVASSSLLSNSSIASSVAATSVSSSLTVSSTIAPASSSAVANLSSAASSTANNLVLEKVSGVIEFTDTDGSALDVEDTQSVTIRLSLLDEQDQVVHSQSPTVLNSVGQINGSLPFAAELSGANAKFLVVHISKDGFTDYARRFAVAEELSIKATLSRIPEGEITASTAVTISGESVDGFNFSVSDKDEPQEAGVGAGIADLTVSIPKSALPAGTTSIDVKMQAFNPNDAEQAAYFPGAYADSDGNQLLSVAFNYTDVTTNAGVSLRKMAESAKGNQSLLQKLGWNKTAAEPIIINRKIPQESCSSLKQLGDSSSELAGFQVPVYTFNSANGLWDLIGQGTLYSDLGELVASDFRAFDCASIDYVLEIKVTNEIFASSWWNLDYPLVFSQPVKMCADIQLLDESAKPIANHTVFVHDEDDERSFSAENFVTDDEGKVHIETFFLDAVDGDTTAELVLYAKNYSAVIKKTITLSTSCAVSEPVVIKTVLPATCKVEGVVKNAAGNPVAKTPVYAGSNGTLPVVDAYGLTDSQGKYSLEVGCNQDYNLVDYFSWLGDISENNYLLNGYDFSVDKSAGINELLDDGKTATLKSITADHSKPIAYAFSGDDENSDQVELQFFYAGNAYPLSYSFDVVDIFTNKVYGHFSGNLTKDNLTDSSYQDIFYMPIGKASFPNTVVWPEEFGMLQVRGEIKDALGAKSNMWGFFVNDLYADELEELDD